MAVFYDNPWGRYAPLYVADEKALDVAQNHDGDYVVMSWHLDVDEIVLDKNAVADLIKVLRSVERKMP